MYGKESRVGRVLVGVAAAVAASLTGCTLGSGTLARALQPAREAAQAPELTPDEQAVLVRIEQYLRRTEAYELTPDPHVASAPADDPVGGPDRRASVAARTSVAASRDHDPGTRPSMPTPALTVPVVRAAVQQPLPQPRDEIFANMHVALTPSPSGAPAPALPVLEALRVRTTGEALPADEEALKTGTTNEPVDIEPRAKSLTLDQVVQRLEQSVGDTQDFERLWQLALLHLALNRDDAAVRAAQRLPPKARRIVEATIDVVAAARAAARDPLIVDDRSVQRADALRRVLAERADPTVSNVALCRQVVTFGVYEEMPPEAFIAGRAAQTIVYCEIGNFRSEETDEGTWRTVLATRLEVFTPDGRSMWSHAEDEIVDLCRRPRHDFFLAQRVSLPATLPVGDYVMSVFVEDRQSGLAGEAKMPFTIVSATAVAALRR